jgi:Flp pilus assembly protein TadG
VAIAMQFATRLVAKSRRQLVRLLRDETGSYLIFMTILTPVLIGVTALGTEGAFWLYTHQTLKAAADAAAFSAAEAYAASGSTSCNAGTPSVPVNAPSIATEWADAIPAAQSGYGFVNGTNGVTVAATCWTPWQDITSTTAIQVTVTAPQPRFFSSYWLANSGNISGSAIAIIKTTGTDCVLALGSQNSNAITASGGSAITLPNCGVFSDSTSNQNNGNDSIVVSGGSTITALSVGTMGGVNGASSITPTPSTGVTTPALNPYATVPLPSSTTIPSALGPPYAPTGTTNAATAPGSSVLTFASGQLTGVTAGMTVQDPSTQGFKITWTATGPSCTGNNGCAITLGTTVSSFTSTTVTLSTPVCCAGTTDAATSSTGANNKVLDFASTPAGVVAGMAVVDATHTGVIPSGTKVQSFTSTTVTLNNSVTGSGVANGDTIQFGPGVVSGDTIQFGCQPGTWLSGQGLNNPPSITLSPGTYCGGTNFQSRTTITFNAGTYIFPGGQQNQLNTGGATLTGTGVTLVFTCPTSGSCAASNQNATANFGGGSTINLTAPTSGTYDGLVLFGDSTMPVGTKFDVSGGSSADFNGVIDLPKAALTYSGGSAAAPGTCTELIADTITFSGGSSNLQPCIGAAPIGGGTPVVSLVQ